jgi:hypothetical protein
MGLKIRKLLPKTDDYLKEGLRLLIINVIIFLGVGGITLGIFSAIYRLRLLGIPLPLPLWLVLLGTGIPCFVFWFQYGKTFGSFLEKRKFIRGLSLGILGDMPGFIILYSLISFRPLWIEPSIYRIIFIIHLMFFVVMPIMVVLGVMDRQ